jgi:hypothetical protein
MNLGGGKNGCGTQCDCDFAVEIGSHGIGGGDDFQTTMFVLSHNSVVLSLSSLESNRGQTRFKSIISKPWYCWVSYLKSDTASSPR